jgi:hypothetical protein
MTDAWWIGKDVKGSRHGLTEVLSGHSIRETEEYHKNPVSVSDIQSQIRTEVPATKSRYKIFPTRLYFLLWNMKFF